MTDAAPATPPNPRHILLVDDDDVFTNSFREYFLSHQPGKWEVHAANHYVPALVCIKQHPVDIIVLSIDMPVMDGMQFLKLLKQVQPKLQIVVLSASVSPEQRSQALQNGAALVLDEAEEAAELEKIQAALEKLPRSPDEMPPRPKPSDVLQAECVGRKSSVLEIAGPGCSGRIFVEESSIIHAECGPVHGESALFHLLRLPGAEVQIKPFANPSRRTIDGRWEDLLKEAARLHDEVAADSIADTGAPGVALDPSAPEIPPGFERDIREIVFCADGGLLLYEWQSPEVDHRVHLLEQFHAFAGSLARCLSLGRTDRVDIQANDNRTIMLLHPDYKVFVQAGIKPESTEK